MGMTYEIADEYTIYAVTDDREEALELMAENPGTWVNVFDSKDNLVEVIE